MEEENKQKKQPSNINNLCIDYKISKTPVFINGLGIGKIIDTRETFVIFEIIKEVEKTKKRKNKETKKMESYEEKTLFKELTNIPYSKIESISEGEKEVPKTEEQSKLDEDLGGL